MLFAKRINRNYFFEFSCFDKIVGKKEWYFTLDCFLTLNNKYDHSPRMTILFILLKWKIFEISIYNVNHACDLDFDIF